MLNRVLQKTIESRLNQQKVSLLIGARRVGKTVLLKTIRDKISASVFWLNGEDADVLALLETRTVANYKRLLTGYTVLIIDEAQYVPDIGRKAKLMIDEIKPLHIILTGSSCKWKEQKLKIPVAFANAYPAANFEVMHPGNYEDWVA